MNASKPHRTAAVPSGISAQVITVSDTLSDIETNAANAREGFLPKTDISGPLASEILESQGFEVRPPQIVPDGITELRQAVSRAVKEGARLVFTTGGTGISPRDLTPEAVIDLLVARLSGVEAALAERNREAEPLGALSRPVVGLTSRDPGATVVVCAPGSPSGVRDTLDVLRPLLGHIFAILDRD